jgi:hypothetical protein
MYVYDFVGPRRRSSGPCQRSLAPVQLQKVPGPPVLGGQPLGANTRAIPPSEPPLHSPDNIKRPVNIGFRHFSGGAWLGGASLGLATAYAFCISSFSARRRSRPQYKEKRPGMS